MNDEFKLGVVIPYYKTGRIREVLMKELVNLLKSQITYNMKRHLEVCIYEDGSSSKWLDLIGDRNFKVIKGEENKGISFARNRAMEYLLNKKECNYIIFIDSDDYIDHDYFNKICNAWFENKRLYYFTDFEVLNDMKKREGLKERVTGIVLHKSIFESGARFDENIRFAEDVDFGNKYLRNILTEPYYIDTVYHYNYGIDRKCLSYQAMIERGDD